MKKILVVEDDYTNRFLIELMLVKTGYEYDSAENSIEALRYFRKTQYDLVIMDILLPGTNGIDTMHAMKELRPEIPVVAVSGFILPGSRHLLLSEGFDEFISKPFPIETLEEILNLSLAGSTQL
ncbi:MAG: response regulator [bacterium]|nr:response regulator [bacterium]